MFLKKLKCSNCDKEIDKNENITIYTNSKNLNVVTNLKAWTKKTKSIMWKMLKIKIIALF